MSSFRRSCLIVARQITAGKHMTPEVEEFAKTLCERVRDAAIQSCDRELDPDRASPMAKRWRAVMPDSSAERLADAYSRRRGRNHRPAIIGHRPGSIEFDVLGLERSH